MNMPFPSREQVESIRKNYPPGTRVMLNNMGFSRKSSISGSITHSLRIRNPITRTG